MVKRFLVYSMAHDRPVRVLLADTMAFQNIRVSLLEEDRVTYYKAGKKNPVTVSLDQILSATYARGDDGDTLKYQLEQEKNEE